MRLCTFFCLAAAAFWAAGSGFARADDFDEWLAEVRSEALAAGIGEETLNAALDGVRPVRRVVKRDRNQAETRLTFDVYKGRVVTPKMIANGRDRLGAHADLLRRVASRYGVQPRFIVAIWGIETRYGAVTGQNAVIPAVATLAYDKRRSSFFRGQLMAALRIVDEGHIGLERLRGSWAGAMGQPQFIPTSYLAYAQDFDGDGDTDIWNSLGDVFASIAHYLKSHGWSDRWTWGRPVRAPGPLARDVASSPDGEASGCRAMRSASRPDSLAGWQARGVRRLSGEALPVADLQARLVMPDGPDGAAFLVYRNYSSILRYNCAHLYALSVGLLSDAVGGR